VTGHEWDEARIVQEGYMAGYEVAAGNAEMSALTRPGLLGPVTRWEDEARIEQEYAADVERAVQLATDDEVSYDGPTGEVVLRRDPYEILAERDGADPAGREVPPMTRAQVAVALLDGHLSAREAVSVRPDLLEKVNFWGADPHARAAVGRLGREPDLYDAAAGGDLDVSDAADEDGLGS
jgi:hypothetical protein